MRKYIHSILILSMVWYLVIAPVYHILHAQDTCVQKLDQAQTEYYQGQFDQAIRLVKECIEAGGLETTELARAYKILAQVYLARSQDDAARLVTTKLLELQPEFKASVEQDPPPFVRLVDEIRAEKLAETQVPVEEDNKWLWIGAGSVAVISLVTIIVMSKDKTDEPKQLPEPPPWPAAQ